MLQSVAPILLAAVVGIIVKVLMSGAWVVEENYGCLDAFP